MENIQSFPWYQSWKLYYNIIIKLRPGVLEYLITISIILSNDNNSYMRLYVWKPTLYVAHQQNMMLLDRLLKVSQNTQHLKVSTGTLYFSWLILIFCAVFFRRRQWVFPDVHFTVSFRDSDFRRIRRLLVSSGRAVSLLSLPLLSSMTWLHFLGISVTVWLTLLFVFTIVPAVLGVSIGIRRLYLRTLLKIFEVSFVSVWYYIILNEWYKIKVLCIHAVFWWWSENALSWLHIVWHERNILPRNYCSNIKPLRLAPNSFVAVLISLILEQNAFPIGWDPWALPSQRDC